MTKVHRKSSAKSSARKRVPKKRSKPRNKAERVVSTKLSPNLAWMFPYLRKALFKMPNLNVPIRIRSYKPSSKRIMRVLGNTYQHNKTVIIATHNQVTFMTREGKLRVKRIVRLPRAQMLDTLAHEIAHLHYPQHGYEHEEFTRAIFKTFGLKERCPHCKGTGRIPLEGRY